MTRVICCGGRDFENERMVRQAFEDLFPFGAETSTIIVHGGARGADRLAGKVAKELGFAVEVHPADWTKHGKAAGPIRNGEMVEAGADLVIAFPGGTGTANMIRQAKRAGIRVYEYA